jgi:hypothetical protein
LNSRIGDPFDPNCPPKPPDDPAAATFMAHPYKFEGYKRWDKAGVVDQVEFVDWAAALGIPPGGTLKLDQDKAVEIALLNSRELQAAKEDVYLSALALTLNRFDFDVQWFARTGPTYTRVGASSLPLESNTPDVTSGLGFNRTLAAGGQLLTSSGRRWRWTAAATSTCCSSSRTFATPRPTSRARSRRTPSTRSCSAAAGCRWWTWTSCSRGCSAPGSG